MSGLDCPRAVERRWCACLIAGLSAEEVLQANSSSVSVYAPIHGFDVKPILFEIGPVAVPSWYFFFCLSAILIFFLYEKSGRQWYPGVRRSFWAESWLAGYPCAWLGARLAGTLTAPETMDHWPGWLTVVLPGPMMSWGGFAGAFLGVCVVAAVRKVPLAACADPLVFAGFAGQSLGRIGCFLNGDDYGKVMTGDPAPFWAVVFTSHPDPQPRIPVQLLESAFCLLVFALFCFPGVRTSLLRFPGNLSLAGAGIYGSGRFFLEYLRDDDRGIFISRFLSPAQEISLIVICWVLIRYFWKKYHVLSLTKPVPDRFDHHADLQ